MCDILTLVAHNTDSEIAADKRRAAMITQIEIDGFKTFKDFKVELAPF